MSSSQKINVSISPPNADTTLSWTSDNSAIASVSDDGIVTALGVGNTTVTASTINNLTAECDVLVGQNPRSIMLNESSLELLKNGDLFQLNTTLSPDTATETAITWNSSDETVATVDSSGLVVSLEAGNCIITATTSNNISATCEINVLDIQAFDYKDEVGGTRITNVSHLINDDGCLVFNQTSDNLIPSDHLPRLSSILSLPKDEAWEIEAEIDFGTIDYSTYSGAIILGNDNITSISTPNSFQVINSSYYYTSSYNNTAINVPKTNNTNLSTYIAGEQHRQDIPKEQVGKDYSGIQTIKYTYINDGYIYYTIGDNTIQVMIKPQVDFDNLKVNVIGNFVLANGKWTTNKTNYILRKLYIKKLHKSFFKDVTSIELSDEEIYIDSSTAISSKLYAKVYPWNSDKNVIWHSSNPDVAKVNENGIVTRVASGNDIKTTMITATTSNGLSAYCIVKVGNTGFNLVNNINAYGLSPNVYNRSMNGIDVFGNTTPVVFSSDFYLLTNSTYDWEISFSGYIPPNRVTNINESNAYTFRSTYTTSGYPSGNIAIGLFNRVSTWQRLTDNTNSITSLDYNPPHNNQSCYPTNAKNYENTMYYMKIKKVGGDLYMSYDDSLDIPLTLFPQWRNVVRFVFGKILDNTTAMVFNSLKIINYNNRIYISNINFTETEKILSVGETYQTSYNITPSNSNRATLVWTSSNTQVATVNSATGLVKAIAAGTSTITATTMNGLTATCNIIVA